MVEYFGNSYETNQCQTLKPNKTSNREDDSEFQFYECKLAFQRKYSVHSDCSYFFFIRDCSYLKNNKMTLFIPTTVK